MDARAALDYIFSRSDICQQKVIVFGRSLGGAVALRVCSESFYATRVAAVIVENTFTSISDMARGMFDFRVLHYLPEWCYKNKVTIILHYITEPLVLCNYCFLPLDELCSNCSIAMLSVCNLRYHGHVGWVALKVITRIIGSCYFCFLEPQDIIQSKQNVPNFLHGIGGEVAVFNRTTALSLKRARWDQSCY